MPHELSCLDSIMQLPGIPIEAVNLGRWRKHYAAFLPHISGRGRSLLLTNGGKRQQKRTIGSACIHESQNLSRCG